MAEVPRSYRIIYDVHCKLQNFFGKEIIVKNCYSEVHAKYKLGAYCEKKYGKDFDFVTFKSVKMDNIQQMCDDIFGKNAMKDIFGNDNSMSDLLNELKNKKKS